MLLGAIETEEHLVVGLYWGRSERLRDYTYMECYSGSSAVFATGCGKFAGVAVQIAEVALVWRKMSWRVTFTLDL